MSIVPHSTMLWDALCCLQYRRISCLVPPFSPLCCCNRNGLLPALCVLGRTFGCTVHGKYWVLLEPVPYRTRRTVSSARPAVLTLTAAADMERSLAVGEWWHSSAPLFSTSAHDHHRLRRQQRMNRSAILHLRVCLSHYDAATAWRFALLLNLVHSTGRAGFPTPVENHMTAQAAWW